jgi:Raf kinase inhibitor-like YbhB/YbcL family protein
MTRRLSLAAAALSAALMLFGCSSKNELAVNSKESGGSNALKVTSPAFADGGAIPERYTADGMNVSPPLHWSKGPGGTKEYVVIVEDADARMPLVKKARPAINWFIYKIPADVTELPEAVSRYTTYWQGKNYLLESGYAGPNPPPGKLHHYYFEVFALDADEDWPAGADRDTILGTLREHVLSKGTLVGTYRAEK